MLARHARTHWIEQPDGLYDTSRLAERRSRELDSLDHPVAVPGDPCSIWILYSPALHHSGEPDRLLCAATESDRADADVRLWVRVHPVLRLYDELEVHVLQPRLVRPLRCEVTQSRGASLRSHAFDVACADVPYAIPVAVEHLLVDQRHVRMVRRRVLLHAVAGAVECRQEHAVGPGIYPHQDRGPWLGTHLV